MPGPVGIPVGAMNETNNFVPSPFTLATESMSGAPGRVEPETLALADPCPSEFFARTFTL